MFALTKKTLTPQEQQQEALRLANMGAPTAPPSGPAPLAVGGQLGPQTAPMPGPHPLPISPMPMSSAPASGPRPLAMSQAPASGPRPMAVPRQQQMQAPQQASRDAFNTRRGMTAEDERRRRMMSALQMPTNLGSGLDAVGQALFQRKAARGQFPAAPGGGPGAFLKGLFALGAGRNGLV